MRYLGGGGDGGGGDGGGGLQQGTQAAADHALHASIPAPAATARRQLAGGQARIRLPASRTWEAGETAAAAAAARGCGRRARAMKPTVNNPPGLGAPAQPAQASGAEIELRTWGAGAWEEAAWAAGAWEEEARAAVARAAARAAVAAAARAAAAAATGGCAQRQELERLAGAPQATRAR